MSRAALVILLLPATLLLATLAVRTPSPRADFVLATDEPRFVDPWRVSWHAEIQLAGALFEGLTRRNPTTLQPEPAVATHWDISPDGRTYRFTLRPEARWSDGTPVTADDFVFAWLELLEPRTAAQYVGLLYVVEGARAYSQSRRDTDPANDLPPASVAIAAADAHTFTVRLAAPCAYFLDLTSFITLAAAPRHLLAGTLDRGNRRNLWTRPGTIVCNGAFVLAEREFKSHLLLRRNPHYWDRAHVGVETIRAQITGDPNVALLAYETGQVDMVRNLPLGVTRRMLARGNRPDFRIGDRFATYFFRVNCRRPPLDDPRVRRALALAVDREDICARVQGIGETPAYTHVPRTALRAMPRTAADGRTLLYDPPAGLAAGLGTAERMRRARQELADSGWDRGRPLEIMYAAENRDYQRVAEAIKEMWESALGIRVTLRPIEGKVLSAEVRNLNYDLVRADWFGDYLDPSTFLDMFTSDNGQNRTGWRSTAYDDLIARATAEADPAQRFALFREAETLLCEVELPIIPLFYRKGMWLLRPEFTGIEDNILEILPIHLVRSTAAAPG